MALFEVPGWSMSSDVKPTVDGKSRKRKRGISDDASSKLQTAEVNVEKLMEKLADVGRSSNSTKRKNRIKQSDRGIKSKAKEKVDEGGGKSEHEPASASITDRKREKDKKAVKDTDTPLSSNDACATSVDSARPRHVHSRKSGASRSKGKKHEAHNADDFFKAPATSDDKVSDDVHLTNLQSKMKQSLGGARFRWINETLYKSSSQDAQRLVHEDPKIYEEYHAGFRHQTTSWPTNPVEHFIKMLSSYPQRSVIVDLGCGDAMLAQKLVPKGYSVLSYDLISANSFIVAADICGKLPLPGSESENQGQIVDVVVCCLSLMNTNWLNCIREARRVLKRGGELKIAEVASRFANVDKFTSVICSIGFRLVSKDERNSHFTVFDFEKAECSMKLDDKLWQEIIAQGNVLQPCEYRRR